MTKKYPEMDVRLKRLIQKLVKVEWYYYTDRFQKSGEYIDGVLQITDEEADERMSQYQNEAREAIKLEMARVTKEMERLQKRMDFLSLILYIANNEYCGTITTRLSDYGFPFERRKNY